MENTNETIHEELLKFLDAKSLEEKYDIITGMQAVQEEFTDAMIDNMAASLDVVIPDGKIDERVEQLKMCIRTKQKYEISRYGRR